MDTFVVRTRGPLSGSIRINGAKNSALKLFAAALLARGTTVLRDVPGIADIHVMGDVLRHLGVGVTTSGETYSLDVPDAVGCETPAHLVQRLRASIVVLGPLLARCGRVRVAMPGGCNLGNRNIDMHLSGLARMGAEITYGPEHLEARAQQLSGADIDLPFASVGATENLLMAAVTAHGETRITNAAREPEIVDLAHFLQSMGADIQGAGTPDVVVTGVPVLRPAVHRVVPDRIEAGTFAVAAAVAGDEVRLTNVVPGHLGLVLDKLRSAGVDLEVDGDTLTVRGGRPLRRVDLVTLPYPGFPTDLQPLILVLLSQAAGTSMVTENVFDARFGFLAELARMGGDIAIEGHHAIIRGPSRLVGARVRATDLRAGAALVVAAMCADGETVVEQAHHVDRGYANFAGRLRALGADVERRQEPVAVGAA